MKRLLIAALIALTSITGQAFAAFPGHNGRIAFTSNRDDNPRLGNLEIYSMNPDGSDVRRLTDYPGADEEAAWSPDGTQIAFRRLLPDGYAIYVMDADGGNATQISEGRFFFPTGDPAWSPDGTQIVFQGLQGGRTSDLYIANADGSGQRKLTDTPDISEFTPAWSPDGTKIAFSHNVPPCPGIVCNFEIFVMNLDGSGKVRLTHDSDQDTDPNWSPDGAKISYGTLNGVTEVRVMDADGTNDVGFAPPALGYTPAWSPDGTQIVWSGFGQGNEINVMDADGSNPRNISNAPSFDVQPDWQPVNRPPECAGVTASPRALSPPNHKLAPVAFPGASDPDGDAVTVVVTSVRQDEPTGAPPDAVHSPAPGEILLRAERDGGGDGRVYRVAFEARDAHGGTCTGTTTVSVRKGSASAVDSAPPSYDSFGP